MRKAEIVTC